MPTGFTSDLSEGEVSFYDFALTCAEAFFYDAPRPLPERFVPSKSYLRRLNEAIADLHATLDWDENRAQQMADEQYKAELGSHLSFVMEESVRRFRYESMLEKVNLWEPPDTDRLHALKQFMIKQLEASIEHDCGHSVRPPVRLSGAEYKARRIERLRTQVRIQRELHKDEIERVEKDNAFLAQLRASLPTPEEG
jgi:hypothetical protein